MTLRVRKLPLQILNSQVDSITTSRVDPAAALAQWNLNRTGPLAEAVSAHHLIFGRFPNDWSGFKTYGDPSSGKTSAHFEIVLLVIISSQLHYFSAIKTYK